MYTKAYQGFCLKFISGERLTIHGSMGKGWSRERAQETGCKKVRAGKGAQKIGDACAGLI